MRKLFLVLLAIGILALSFSACGDESSTPDTPQPPAQTKENTPEGAPETAPNESEESVAPTKAEFATGETWTVEGQWSLTVDTIEETDDRNEFSDLSPAAVYIVTFTYTNIGYEDANGIMDGLYFLMDDSIIDCEGYMGYSYPGNITRYPQETPIGATCTGQVCIGVDHAGVPIKINVSAYDGNEELQKATFEVQ